MSQDGVFGSAITCLRIGKREGKLTRATCLFEIVLIVPIQLSLTVASSFGTSSIHPIVY